MGKPVVGTGFIPTGEAGRLVRMAQTPEGFVSGIESCLIEDDMTLAEQRVEVASQNSWDRRVDRLLELVTSRLGR